MDENCVTEDGTKARAAVVGIDAKTPPAPVGGRGGGSGIGAHVRGPSGGDVEKFPAIAAQACAKVGVLSICTHSFVVAAHGEHRGFAKEIVAAKQVSRAPQLSVAPVLGHVDSAPAIR